MISKPSQMPTLRTFTLIGLCIGALALLAGCAAESEHAGTFDPQTGQFAPCPDNPNCVSSQESGEQHGIEPLPFAGDLANTKARILELVNAMPRAQIETDTPNYLHVTFRSRIFRFVDDVEFHFDETRAVVDFRAAARTGYSDMGVNRARMETIRQEVAE